jgi:hypothetical protein
MRVTLNQAEIKILSRQHPATRNDGGYQRFLVDLQEKVDPITGEIELTKNDLTRIPKYAFDYGQGGWEKRFLGAFGRVLGKNLGR